MDVQYEDTAAPMHIWPAVKGPGHEKTLCVARFHIFHMLSVRSGDFFGTTAASR